MHFSMISVPYTEYLKFRKNWILYTRILTKKYHIPELKWPEIPYTQKPLAGPDWWDPTNLNKKACTDGQKKVKTDSTIDRRM